VKELRGKTALLTGADGGLGAPIARALAAAGMDLCLTGYPGAGLGALRARVEREGLHACTLAADLREPPQRECLVQAALRQWGRVDVLVNNAGVEYAAPYHDRTPAQIETILTVNLAAPMHLTRRLLPGMLERRCGHVVNLSSLALRSDMPGAFNIVPDDCLRLSQVWKLIGAASVRTWPLWASLGMAWWPWRYAGSSIHPSWVKDLLLDFTGSNLKLKAAGWQPSYGSADALLAAL
jgi:NAD(P)-dependent dehydrogenase (short-subunit alcohol dehydrogenase family)